MSGHSKWKKVKHKKAASDAKRGKIFTKLLKEITIAARQGGGDPEFNPRLRLAILSAKQNNVPGGNIDRAVKKGMGELGGAILEEVTYEGYGPGGVAVLVDVITDNKNRTVSEIRSAFTKYNGNLGASGSVAWMFTKKGILTIDANKTSEDQLMEILLEAGADDIRREGDSFEIYTTPEQFEAVKEALEKNKIEIHSSELSMEAGSTIHLSGKQAEQMLTLLEILEDHDDVKQVYANFDVDEEEIEKIAEKG